MTFQEIDSKIEFTVIKLRPKNILNFRASETYLQEKNIIDEEGFIRVNWKGNQVRFYTPELLLTLIDRNLGVQNRSNKEFLELNGLDFLDEYFKGYFEGRNDFDQRYSPLSNFTCPEKGGTYLEELQYNYYEKRFENGFVGYSHVKVSPPKVISKNVIFDYGFYSGLVSKVEDLVSDRYSLREYFQHPESPLKEKKRNS